MSKGVVREKNFSPILLLACHERREQETASKDRGPGLHKSTVKVQLCQEWTQSGETWARRRGGGAPVDSMAQADSGLNI